jgi:ribosomal protein L18
MSQVLRPRLVIYRTLNHWTRGVFQARISHDILLAALGILQRESYSVEFIATLNHSASRST